jgi:hypothetical protein
MGNGLSISALSTYGEGEPYGSHYDSNELELDNTARRQRARHTMNFEDVQFIINVDVTAIRQGPSFATSRWNAKERFLLINTLPANQQGCLIRNTVDATDEEARINDIISGRDDDGELITVVVYGKNATDETVATKCAQLKTLGISNVCAYVGGMFEWLLLQDIYGVELFPTTGKCADLLEYRPASALRHGTRKMIQ